MKTFETFEEIKWFVNFTNYINSQDDGYSFSIENREYGEFKISKIKKISDLL